MKEVNTGRINQTLAKQYQFDVKGLLRKAASLTKMNFGSLLQGCVVLFLTFVVLGIIVQPFITVHDDGTYTFEHQSIIEIVAICVVAPLLSGLYMMGVSQARGHKITVFSTFQYFPLIFLLALTQLINSILVQLGMMLLLIPGIYFYLASTFSIMLVADKKLTPISAIILSCRLFNAYWKQLVSIYAVIILLFITVPFTLGFSLIWVLPFYFSITGLLYQELAGDSSEGVSTLNDGVNESSFDA